uniref:Uncharacterized protein n=1 Tax=Romanomermis culicivorax TaxID=13658 RepID=A0A915HLU7_ROMCU
MPFSIGIEAKLLSRLLHRAQTLRGCRLSIQKLENAAAVTATELRSLDVDDVIPLVRLLNCSPLLTFWWLKIRNFFGASRRVNEWELSIGLTKLESIHVTEPRGPRRSVDLFGSKGHLFPVAEAFPAPYTKKFSGASRRKHPHLFWAFTCHHGGINHRFMI